MRSRAPIAGIVAVAGSFLGAGCQSETPTEPNDFAPAFSVETPEVTQTEWDNAVNIFELTEYGTSVLATAQSQAPYEALIVTATVGKTVGVFVPSTRHDVMCTVVVNGNSSSGMLPGDFRWELSGGTDDAWTVHALQCHVQGHQNISGYSNHWARWGGNNQTQRNHDPHFVHYAARTLPKHRL